MITPQLTAYIRAQSAAGVSREAIRRSLLLNDWADQDIDEAFAQMGNVVPPKAPVARVAIPSFTGRKLALSLGLIVISAVYAVWQNIGGSQSFAMVTPVVPAQTTSVPVTPTVAPTTPSPSQTNTGQTTSAPKSTPPTSTPVVKTPTPAPAPVKPAGQYTDGSYTGSAANAYYGTIQVQAIVTNGQLADVQFLQYPSDRSTSRYINSQAMPMLTQEAIQAQNANVNGVSGATDTSQAFVQSLSSALAQAKN